MSTPVTQSSRYTQKIHTRTRICNVLQVLRIHSNTNSKRGCNINTRRGGRHRGGDGTVQQYGRNVKPSTLAKPHHKQSKNYFVKRLVANGRWRERTDSLCVVSNDQLMNTVARHDAVSRSQTSVLDALMATGAVYHMAQYST